MVKLCGICGILGFEDENLLKRMEDVMSYRGPDDSGMFLDKDIGLGHRRLSIIDLRGGKQPIHNEDESVWTVYNGEIYNYKELKKLLEEKGHQFYTNSDTEVLVHLYEEYGDTFVTKLNGMFAFAIWDGDKKKLLLARDRLGIKPLYYTSYNGCVLFASEIKSILQYKEIKRHVNIQSLHNYLTFRYVPEPETMFQGIKKLPPGHIMICSSSSIYLTKYWDLNWAFSPEQKEGHYCKKLLDLLEDSVKIRLMSEVPLGVFLSGGLDSSTVVALMKGLVDTPIKTFSAGYGLDNFMDELEPAQKVAEYFGTDHHEFILDFNPIECLPETIWHMDEPVADPAILPTYMLSKMAKKYVTVILVGEGSDEIFGGYEQYKFMLINKHFISKIPNIAKLKIIPFLLRKTPDAIIDTVFKYTSSLGDEGKKRFLDFISSGNNISEGFIKLVSIFTEQEKKGFYSENFLNTFKNLKQSKDVLDNYIKANENIDSLNQMINLDIKTFLPSLLLRVDKTTMSSSVEARVPFLDHRLVEFSTSIPSHLKLRRFNEKYILKKSVSEILPKYVLRRKKQRFFVPIDLWVKENYDMISQILSEPVIKKNGYFRYKSVRKIWDNYQKSRLYSARQIWNLFTFELWYRIYIENNDMQKPSLSIDKLIS